MKKYYAFFIILITLLLTAGCLNTGTPSYTKYSYEFLGAFDTPIQFLGYATSSDEFETMVDLGQSRFMELHKLYDIYNDYEGIINAKTINDNAGIKPVKVQKEIIDLIIFSKDWYSKTNGKCNIALGSVLKIWHDYREVGKDNPENAKIPPLNLLREAMQYTDLNSVIVDTNKSTVYLENKNMRLDLGAVAKGYASEIVARELMDKGYTSFIISSGGNVRVIGKPIDSSRNKWGIGIQNPFGNPHDPNEPSLDVLYLNDQSVVTSGDYQRYYTVNEKTYHHLIDPETLMPADYFKAVSIVTEDSGVADFISTTLFLTPYEEGRKLAESLGIDAVWVFHDGTIATTDNAKKIMKNLGGAKNTDDMR